MDLPLALSQCVGSEGLTQTGLAVSVLFGGFGDSAHAVKVGRADLFVVTGLDLETWVPALLRKAGNSRVRPGAVGYVRAAENIQLLDVPSSGDRSQGDAHLFGNPHIHASVLDMRVVIRNIAAGLVRVDPENRDAYTKAAEAVVADLDSRMFGPRLTKALGGDLAARLAARGKLLDLLNTREFEGRPMSALLGGWMARLAKARGARIAIYHKNWAYLAQAFGIRVAVVAEPKPGVPPTASHIVSMLDTVKQEDVKGLLAAGHYSPRRVRAVAEKVGLEPVSVPFHVGSDGTKTYPDLVERWVRALERTVR
jgi:zinc/manganese transport system substrate-binding protein